VPFSVFGALGLALITHLRSFSALGFETALVHELGSKNITAAADQDHYQFSME
jgi:hypothetical protein